MSDSDDSESSAFEIISEGPASTVTKTTLQLEDGEQHQLVAVKSASLRRKFSAEPHDIIKELRILSTVSHANIIHVLGHTVENATLSFWMPYVPLSLHELLSSPRFSPYTYALGDSVSTSEETQSQFLVVSRSILVQICAALAYLHAHDIANRDIKPRNVLLTTDGCVKLIDFGISYSRSMCHDPEVTRGDLWPESEGKMYFQVSTGPYRAPELLFRPPVYDAHACDLWSLGTMMSEFFTPLRLEVDDDDDDDDEGVTKDNNSSGSTATPFIIPSTLSPAALSHAIWNRDPIFDSTRGEIGLAWSIFKVCGTPTEDNWPTFSDLPDANKLTFNIVPRVADLSPLLPNLPPSPNDRANVLEAINGLLAYPPSARLPVLDILHLGIMKGTKVMPPGYDAQTYGIQDSTSSWKGRSLGEWIRTFY